MRSFIITAVFAAAPLAVLAAPAALVLAESSAAARRHAASWSPDWRVRSTHQRAAERHTPKSKSKSKSKKPLSPRDTDRVFNPADDRRGDYEPAPGKPRKAPRAVLDLGAVLGSQLDQLCAYRDSMSASQSALGGLAALAESSAPTDPLFQKQCVSQLLSFQQALGGYKTLLGTVQSDKGIAYLDRSNDVENSMNDIITFIKDLLKNMDAILYYVPVVGPAVGDVVYNIKCNIDDIANGFEDVADATMNSMGLNLNVLQPSLLSLAATATNTACGCNAPTLAGLNLCL